MTDSLLDSSCTQEQFAQLVGISQTRVSQLLARSVLIEGETMRQWARAYCTHLRRVHHEPVTSGARDRLAVARARSQELRNAKLDGSLVPVIEVRAVVASVSARAGRLLESIPVRCRREVGLDDRAVALVEGVVIQVRVRARSPSSTACAWSASEERTTPHFGRSPRLRSRGCRGCEPLETIRRACCDGEQWVHRLITRTRSAS
jgi:phage terminase Nu1 subunit (DNA packaging protein)